MATITAADWDTAIGTTGGTAGADDLPLFEAGETVFNVDDFDTSASGSNKDIEHKAYTILEVVLSPQTESTVTKLMDQSLTFATPATSDSGVTTRSVFGWAHTTTPANSTTATTPSGPYFYNVQDESGNVVRTVHQTKLTDLAAIEAYVAAEVAGWWS
jgi:hypothetical protein